MNCIIYCRVSTAEQMRGTSLEVQETACRDYARERNIEVLQVFVEEGESAKFADRTRLLELIEFCRAKKDSVNLLLVWKVDRFARNVADHFSIKATLSKSGVRIVSVTEPIDTKPEGRLLETMLAGFAQFDNDIRSMRTMQGMRRKLQDGIFPWRPPLGYKSAVASGEKKTRPDLPDPSVFPLLQRAWREFATGAYTQAEIGRKMRTWGLQSVRGNAFSPQSLYQLFTNPYYVGRLMDPWNGTEHVGKHVPLVTPTEFAQVQRVITRRNRSLPHHKYRIEFPLRGVVRCELCNRYLTASSSRGRSRKYNYYHCQQEQCPRYGKSWPAEAIHAEMTDHLDRLTPTRESMEKLEDMIVDEAGCRLAHVEEANNRRRQAASRPDQELSSLIRMRAQELITDQEFLQQKRGILDQRHAIEANVADAVSVKDVMLNLKRITAPLSQLRHTWEALPPARRRRFHNIAFPFGYVRGTIGTAETAMLLHMVSSNGRTDSSGVHPTSETWNRIGHEISRLSAVLEGLPDPEMNLAAAI